MNHYIRTTLPRMAVAAVSLAIIPLSLYADLSPVTKARLGSLYPDDLVVTDISVAIDTNTNMVRIIVKDELVTATNGFIRTESDPTVGLTNSTVYASGTNVTFLTSHQDLSFTNDYRKVRDAINWVDVTNHDDFVDSEYVSEAIVSAIVDNLTSTATNKALSANKGRELEEQIKNLQARGRYLSVWDASAGLPNTDPPVTPYIYKAGDYYIVGSIGATNYRPSGSVYTNGVRSTEVETNAVSVNDTYYFDNDGWTLVHLDQPSITFSSLSGEPDDNAALSNRFYTISEELHSITGDVYVVSTNLQITASNLSDRIYSSLDAIRDNKKDIDTVNYTVGLLISSNELMSIAISGLSTNISNVEESVMRVAASIPERTPDNVYTNLSQYVPVFVSGGRSDRILYIRAVDGAYHDARTISGYPGSEVYANTFQEAFPVSSLYGHEFSYAYLTNILPQVTWTSGFTLSADNLHATAESVCGARGFWTFYGRPALVRDLVYVLMWRDHYLWYDNTGMTGYSRMFVDFRGLRTGLDSAVDYAASAHKSIAELSYRLASGTGCASVPISSDTIEATSLVTTVTVTPDIIKSVHVQDSAYMVILEISAPSAMDDRSRKCATETRLTVDSQVTVRVGSADAWGSVTGQDLFKLGAGEYIVGTQRIAYNANDGTCLYTAYVVDIYDQFYVNKASLSDVTRIVASASVTNAGAVAGAKAYTDSSLSEKQDVIHDYTSTNAVNDIIEDYDNTVLASRIAAKQDMLDEAQTKAVNSGITAEKIAVYDAYASGKRNITDLRTYSPRTVPSSWTLEFPAYSPDPVICQYDTFEHGAYYWRAGGTGGVKITYNRSGSLSATLTIYTNNISVATITGLPAGKDPTSIYDDVNDLGGPYTNSTGSIKVTFNKIAVSKIEPDGDMLAKKSQLTNKVELVDGKIPVKYLPDVPGGVDEACAIIREAFSDFDPNERSFADLVNILKTIGDKK